MKKYELWLSITIIYYNCYKELWHYVLSTIHGVNIETWLTMKSHKVCGM